MFWQIATCAAWQGKCGKMEREDIIRSASHAMVKPGLVMDLPQLN